MCDVNSGNILLIEFFGFVFRVRYPVRYACVWFLSFVHQIFKFLGFLSFPDYE
jgi:hypothetical protein